MPHIRPVKKLTKFITYILGHKPDEFGLVPDEKGFIKIKELLKVLSEEKGWKFVRRQHIDEILFTIPNPLFEIVDNRIRIKKTDNLPDNKPVKQPPKLLYTCVRRRAYPYVVKKGIFPSSHNMVIMSSDQDMAERIGKRIDQKPVLLTVHVNKSTNRDIIFYQVGETIYTANHIPPGCFTGPPLPEDKKVAIQKKGEDANDRKKLAGTFILDLDKLEKKQSKRDKKKDKISRKKSIRNARKQKQRMWQSGC